MPPFTYLSRTGRAGRLRASRGNCRNLRHGMLSLAASSSLRPRLSMTTPLRRILPWIVFWLLLAASAAAQERAPAPSPAPANDDQRSLSRFPGLFEIDLPKTERRGNIRFIYQPHFRDLIDKSYLRIPLEFRWGVNDHFELNSDIDTYVTHGLRKATTGYGLSTLHFGAKYAWHVWLKPIWDTSVGFN